MAVITELRRGLKDDIANSKRQVKDREAHRGDSWNIQDSDFYDYIERFYEGEVWDQNNYSKLKDGYHIVDDLQANPSPTVIDLMSTTAAVSSLFYDIPQKDKLGIAVARRDNRTIIEKARDEKLGIKQLAGDLMDKSTWKAIEKALDGRKADLIVECGLLGVTFLPDTPRFYGIMARRAWNLLNPNGGRLIAQALLHVGKWVNILSNNGIEADWIPSSGSLYSTVRLQRQTDSPHKLPLGSS